jgi:hypothetical protein
MEDVKEQPYVKPTILATYSREELEDSIRPHGSIDSYTDNNPTGGCGCGS